MKLHYAMNLYLEGYVYTDKDLCKLYTKEWQLESLYLSISSLKIKYLLRLRRLKKIIRFMKHRFLHI